MRRFAIPGFFLFIFIAFLAGCGGGSSANNTVTTVTVAPTSVSVNSGAVTQLSVTATNSAGSPVSVSSFTFTSSNTAVVTVSPTGLVCGGVWDSTFINCNGLGAGNVPISGTANITVAGGGVTSSPVPVAVHPEVTAITVDPVAGCTSSTQTRQFTAHAFHNATDITGQAGAFTWSVVDTTVASVDTNGLVTARNPGLTGIIASLSGINSVATPYRTCMPVRLRIHVAGATGTSATLSVSQTATLQVDMDDENGFTTNNAPASVLTTDPVVASIAGATLTGLAPGGAEIIASCIPSICGNGLNLPMYSNPFLVTVTGSSPTTTVYATSSFAPPSGTSPTLVPIDTSTNTAGTALNLPGVPNSLVFARSGLRAYLGTNAGLVLFDLVANTVTLVNPQILGKVLAVSPNGSRAIVSNAANDPSTGTPIEPNAANQRLFVYDQGSNTFQVFVVPGAVAAEFNADGFRDYAVANNGNVYVFSPALTFQTTSISGSSTSVAALASGPFVYIANSAGLEVVATCNNVQQPTVNNPPTTSALQLVTAAAGTDLIVALNSSGLDVETVTLTPLTPPVNINAGNCPPAPSYAHQFIDFGLGGFTGRQLLVATNGSRAAVLPAGINKVLSAVPTGGPPAIVNLGAGATEPLSGGMTPDGNIVWVGVAGSNTVDKIDLIAGADTVQVVTTFKKPDSSAAPPNIVALRPK